MARSVYGNVKEHVPPGIPQSLGQFVVTTHYVDANLLHDHVTGRSVTAAVYLINGTPATGTPRGKSLQKLQHINRKCFKRTLSRLLAVALRMYLTLHLLLFAQLM